VTPGEAEQLLDGILAEIRRVEWHAGTAYQVRCAPEFFDDVSEAMAILGRFEKDQIPIGKERLFLTFPDHKRIMVREDPGIDSAIGAYILGPEIAEELNR
jgi:hypothetical protein